MMNAKRSANINLTRYAFLVPVVVVCLFAFSLSKAEVVKTSPIYKTFAKTVHTLNGIVLSADTTPKPKKVTRTFIVTTDTTGKAGKKIYVTTNDKVSTTYNAIIDTGKRVPVYQNFGSQGGRNRNLDTVRRTYRMSNNVRVLPGGLYATSVDTVTTIMINGKKGTFEDLKRLGLSGGSGVTGLRGFRDFIVVDKNANVTADSSEPVIMLNGKKINKDELSKLPADQLENIQVFKHKNVVIVNGKPVSVGTTNIRANQSFSYSMLNDSTLKNDRFKALSVKGFGNLMSLSDKTKVDFANGPLIMIDEKEADEKQAKKVSVNDIENMTILKGPTATRIYGEKAKKGAIIITTKKGKK